MSAQDAVALLDPAQDISEGDKSHLFFMLSVFQCELLILIFL